MEHHQHQPQRLRPQKHLRSRSRRLYSEIFEPEDNITDHGGEQVVHSWSINGRFSYFDPSSDQYTANHTNHTTPTFVGDIGIQEPTRPQPQPNQQPPLLAQHQDQRPYDEHHMLTTIYMVISMILAVAAILNCFYGEGGPPGEEFHRGALIRAQARRVWEIEEKQAKRQEATPAERLASIQRGVCDRRVLRIDPNTGVCELGEAAVEVELPSGEDDDDSEAVIAATGIESKTSMDTTATLSIDLEDDTDTDTDTDTGSGGSRVEGQQQESDKSSRTAEEYDDNFDNEQEDDVCPVCLDGYEIGDTVMFSRNPSCTHVFHKECLLPWLLERRENECPSCRAILVRDDEGGCIDLERGRPVIEAVEDDRETTMYFISKGRIVLVPSHDKNETETAKDGLSSHGPTVGTEGSNHTTVSRISLPSQDTRMLPNTRVLSVASDLSIPLPLRRISLSVPIDRRRSQPCDRFRNTPTACCDNICIGTNTVDQWSPRSKLQEK